MAVNLGAVLRDAVDGPPPGLDAVVGEDPADVDLPALSARIRRRRRRRAGAQSALGVAAAGAVAVTGLTATGARPDEPALPAAAAPSRLCGLDVSTLPETSASTLLVPPRATVVPGPDGGVTVSGLTNLGVLTGRRLVTTVVESGVSADRGPTSGAAIVLTRGSAVVATGEAVSQSTLAVVGPDDGQARVEVDLDAVGVARVEFAGTTAYPISATLVACDPAGGTPADGLYSVQYVVPGGNGLRRAAGAPWTVRLLPEAAAAAAPDGYPADEVPLVAGEIEQVGEADTSDTVGGVGAAGAGGTASWRVRVTVTGDDGLARAADALRAAGADVAGDGGLVTEEVGARYQVDGTTYGLDQLDDLQAAADAADVAAQEAQAALDDLGDSADEETRVLARLEATRREAEAARARQTLAEVRGAVDGGHAYRFGTATSFTARTASWDVEVTATSPTVLEYRLTPATG